jgi:predicted aldo/keto reductase-like oxidoreductase
LLQLERGILIYMSKSSSINRRDLIAGATLGLAGMAQGANSDIPYRTLGQTGEKVSLVGLGGYHMGKPKVAEAEAVRLIRSFLDQGFNFLDNSWDYNEGQSEIRGGKALRDGYRKKAFVMTKVDGRTKEAAAKQIDESLRRLQTDHIDLLQHHEVIRFDDPDRIFAPGGAMEAFVEAKKAGKIRYIGFTGHKDPHIHLYMLKVADDHGFHFDSVQMPLNVMDAHFRSFGQLVVPEAVKRNIGILGMKSMGGSVILKSNTATPMECLHYAMNLPVSVVITGIDSQQILDQAVQAAKSFKPMSAPQVSAILSKTAKAAASGTFELFKTTGHFDSTATHPDWLGGETKQVADLAQGT